MADQGDAISDYCRTAVDASLRSTGPAVSRISESSARVNPLDIAIPIYNNAKLLQRCLDSLLPTLSEGDLVWLIDDASTEPEVNELLRSFSSKWSGTQILRNEKNLGFVGSSNRVFRATHRDIVLLNSDTELTLGWLEQLQSCLERNSRAGIVCPVSDQATLLSVLPSVRRGEREKLVAEAGGSSSGDMVLPTAVGFCMLLRRAMLDHLEGFSQAFSPGYGEENDLSMRAMLAGWDILAADRACVFHHSGGSFSANRRAALRRSHQMLLDRLWPEYAGLVQSWWRDNPLRIRTEQLAGTGDRRDSVLHVLHRQYLVGGTERVARSLIESMTGRFRQTLVYPGETGNSWCDLELQSTAPCRELMLNNRWIRPSLRVAGHGADLRCAHSERSLVRLVRGSCARVVHFHHMLHWDSLLLPAVAKALGCRVVISVHDFWFNCPIHNQLEHATGQPCGRSHLRTDERCAECLGAVASGPEFGLGQFQSYSDGRYALIGSMLGNADAIVVPSEFIQRKLIEAYPEITPKRIRIMPPGVARPRQAASVDRQNGIVVAYLGGDQALKGAEMVLFLAHSLQRRDITFRIHGRIKNFELSRVPPNVELRGFYGPDHLSTVLQDVDLALIPSYYEESFSMVASECWAHGVPVLASDRGALSERVVDGVNGWRVPDMEPSTWLQELTRLLDRNTLSKCRKRLSERHITSTEEAACSMIDLYGELLGAGDVSIDRGENPPILARFDRKLLKLRESTSVPADSTACLGVVRDHWGTPAYRARFPLLDLEKSGAVERSRFHVVRDAGFDLEQALEASAARRIVVQPFLSDEGLQMMERLHRTGARITLVVDDLWTGLQPDNPALASMPNDIEERLKYAASLSRSLVLTTPELKRRLNLQHTDTHVINNALPGWIWEPLGAGAWQQTKRRLRIGWSGAPQHGSDLDFLEPVIRQTADLADWILFGMCPEALRPLIREHYPMVPFEKYPQSLAGLGLDLAVAPLSDHAFNRCKSHLKVLEFGVLGIPVIACDLEPYRHCPVHLAAADDAAGWTDIIKRLLRDHTQRRQLGMQLREWVLANHMTEHRRLNWCAALGITDYVD